MTIKKQTFLTRDADPEMPLHYFQVAVVVKR